MGLLPGAMVNIVFFMIVVVALFVLLGMISRSGAVGAFGGFLAFATLAVETEHSVFMPALFAIVSLLMVVTGYRVFSMTTEA